MNAENSLNMMVQKDVLLLNSEGRAYLFAEMPPGGGVYLIAIQVSSPQFGTSEYLQKTLDANVLYVDTTGKEQYVKLTFPATTDKSSLVGLFTFKPFNDVGLGSNIVFGMRAISMRLILQFNLYVVFGGVTISRL